jgi:hypothetical protein
MLFRFCRAISAELASTVGVHTDRLARSRFEVWAGYRGWR